MTAYQQRLSVAVVVSLVLHISVAWFYASTQITKFISQVFSRTVSPQELAKQSAQVRALRKVRQPPQLSFIEVDATQATLAKPANPKFFSDRSSLAANPTPLARSADIPKIEGRVKDSLDTTDVRLPSRSQPPPAARSRPAPQVAPKPAATPTPPALTMRAKTEAEARPQPPQTKDGITSPEPLRMAAATAGAQQAKPTPQTPATATSEPVPQFRMSGAEIGLRPETRAAPSSDREIPTMASRTEGGVDRRGPVALNVIGMPQGAYSKKMFATIGRLWTLLLEQHYSDGAPGKVKLDFRLHPDGRVDNLVIAQNTATGILASYCQKSVLDSAPFEPWPDELKLLGGDHLDISVEFNVYVY
ncbi:MAG: hypothetical protein HZA91_03505 [Verrucomicrobia bacterium]|nr:hypothetical protein [Verrucomicrobiota bacterium]